MIKNVLEYLEHAALFHPGTGITDETGFCSYSALLKKSVHIGSALATLTEANRPVPVLMDKSADTLAVFFGIVQAGCCYTLLNPELPDNRLKQVLSVLNSRYLITESKYKNRAESLVSGQQILMTEDLLQAPLKQTALSAIRRQMIDADPLYINFTSGSTGVPKGVVISHRSVIDFIEVFPDLFSITSEDVIANQAPFDFDVSVKDIYSAVRTGARLVLIPRKHFSHPTDLLDCLCSQKITTMIWSVSALCLITTVHGLDYRTPTTVNKVLFSGEVMPEKHLRAWMEHLPDAMFVNLYGPTEITCNCTYHVIDRSRDYRDGLPIGKSFPNERVFLLDQENRPVTETEVPGEICVSGTAVGSGYFKAADQTAVRFTQNPLNDCYSERIYRTGDLGCWNERGELRFLGRKDFQIKYQGHRIELEEIERAMMQIEGIQRACCVYDHERNRLYGFYVGEPDRKEVHSELRKLLPVYMIPGWLQSCEFMPLTKNGKIDRAALVNSLRKEKM